MNTEIKSKLESEILEMFENGQSKNEIASHLMMNGVEFSKIPTFMKNAGLKFQRSANSWDQFTDFWVENGGGTKDELVAYLQEVCEWDKEKAKKYSSSYYYPMNRIAESVQVEAEEVPAEAESV